MSAEEIYSVVCVVYGHRSMRKGNERQWYNIIKDGRKYIHDEEQSCQPSVTVIILFQSVDQIMRGKIVLHDFRTFG
jgi:hypothetical protein